MAGKTENGSYDPKDYNLGKGKVYISELDVNGLPVVWRDLGNVPALTVNTAQENLDHFSSRVCTKTRDQSVTLTKDLNLGFELDSISDENLAMFLSADLANYTNPAIAGEAEFTLIADDTLVSVSVWYDLKTAAGLQAYGLQAANVILASTNAVPVILALGTDYELDLVMGMVRFLDSTAVQAIISGNEGVTLELTADAAALNLDEVRSLTKECVDVAIKFVSLNSANACKQQEFLFHKVKITADGDYQGISDEWSNMSFTGQVESNDLASPDSPHLTVRTLKLA